MGSYCSAVSEDGSKVFITWMGNRGFEEEKEIPGKRKKKIKFNTCALTVIHIPPGERK